MEYDVFSFEYLRNLISATAIIAIVTIGFSLVAVIALLCFVACEGEENCENLDYRDVWNTNSWQYVSLIDGKIALLDKTLGRDEIVRSWYLAFMDYPDVSLTNAFSEVLLPKRKLIIEHSNDPAVYSSSNCWIKTAEFAGRMKLLMSTNNESVVKLDYENDVRTNLPNAFGKYRCRMINLWNNEVSVESAHRAAFDVIATTFINRHSDAIASSDMMSFVSNLITTACMDTNETNRILQQFH